MTTVIARTSGSRTVLIRCEQLARWGRLANRYAKINPDDYLSARVAIAHLQLLQQWNSQVAPVDEQTLINLHSMFDAIAEWEVRYARIKLVLLYVREQLADLSLALLSLDVALESRAE